MYRWVLTEYPPEAKVFLKTFYNDTTPGDEIIILAGVPAVSSAIITASLPNFSPQWPTSDSVPVTRYSLGLAGSANNGQDYGPISAGTLWAFKTEPIRIDSVSDVSGQGGTVGGLCRPRSARWRREQGRSGSVDYV